MLVKMEGGRRCSSGVSDAAPLVTIITVVYGAREELASLLESIFQLDSVNVELIVVDGGSKDGTRELLTKFNNKIEYWLSEPDRGIYDAMNKGIAAARGDFLLHLNAGDRLLSLPLQELKEAKGSGTDVVAFRVSIDGRYDFRPSYGWGLKFNNTLHHQGTFFRRQTFLAYDTHYKIFADFDVNQRLALTGARFLRFSQVVTLHASGGISNVPSSTAKAEFFSVIAKNYGPVHVAIAWCLAKWRGLKIRLAQFLSHGR